MISLFYYHFGGGILNYYNEIKNELIDNELTKKAKDYSKNPIIIKNSLISMLLNIQVILEYMLQHMK